VALYFFYKNERKTGLDKSEKLTKKKGENKEELSIRERGGVDMTKDGLSLGILIDLIP